MHTTRVVDWPVTEKLKSTSKLFTVLDSRLNHQATSVCQIFLVGLLLTGNVIAAEAAMLEAIESLDPNDVNPFSLLQRTIELSIEHTRYSANPACSETGAFLSSFPLELREVLKMDAPLRQPFVLRFLLGLSKDACGCVLGWDRSSVETSVVASLQWITGERTSPEHSDSGCTDVDSEIADHGGPTPLVQRIELIKTMVLVPAALER